jgi:homoserine kinase type II
MGCGSAALARATAALSAGLWRGFILPVVIFRSSAGDKLSGLIDFYFACTDTLAYDVAVCLNAWCFEVDHSYNVTKGRELLQSYTKARPLSAAEKEALPILCRGAALRFLLTRLEVWLDVPPGALLKPKDPQEYFRKLRFHQAARSVRDYGIDA